MANVKIMHDNYLQSDEIVSTTYSSQNANAPASNILPTVKRSSVWRSEGYWNITSANKGIVFRESVGVNLTANIAESAYTSDSSFLTAIKTALDAAGDSTYTVTRDATTNKIKITSNGSGGGGIFQLMWTNAGSTAAATLGFSTASDDTGALNYTADTLKIHTEEFIRWDLGVSSNPKALVLTGLANEPIKISESAVVKIQGNNADTWSSPAFEQTLTVYDDGIAHFNSAGFHSSALRYWRLHIVDASNSYGYIEIAKAYLGDVFEPDNGTIQFPFKTRKVDYSNVMRSENGQVFASVRGKAKEMEFDWFNLSDDEQETMDDFVDEVGLGYPFFICIDPNNVMSDSATRWVKYIRFVDIPEIEYVSPGVWSSDWKVREET